MNPEPCCHRNGRASRVAVSWLPLLLAMCAACGSTPEPEHGMSAPIEQTAVDATEWTASALSRSEHLRVEWRSLPSPIPINEDFELEVRVTRNEDAARPITGAVIEVHGSMPAHGHGMLRQPRSIELGEGLYRVRGMLLHMGGHWELLLTIIDDDIAHTADFVLDL